MGGHMSIPCDEVDALRRRFLHLGAGLAMALAGPRPAGAQDLPRVHQLGVLASNTPTAELVGPAPRAPAAKVSWSPRDHGWMMAKNILIHCKVAKQRIRTGPT